MALDLDMAIATRARAELRQQIHESQEQAGEDDGLSTFCTTLVALLSE